ncbi:hypothetical protein ONZ45_g9490 [Pleurotus djamor]|nr:hypothetical protein ONZ45_g9490 [Pleurotus djamor]
MARYALFVFSALAALSAYASPVDNQVTLSDDSVHITESWEYSDCGLPTDPIQIKSIEVTPNPPKPGAEITVTVKAEATERVEEGAYAEVAVKLGRITILKKSFDLCEEARKAETDVQCPVEKGEYEVVQTVQLPKEIPPAKVTVQVRGYTADDDDLVCLDLNVDFRKHPFFAPIGW